MPALTTEVYEWSTLMEFDAAGRLIYTGQCYPGLSAGTAQPIWRINKQEYDGAGFSAVAIKWAEGTNKAVLKWSDRASYTFS